MNVHYGDILVKYGEVLDVSTEQIPYIVDDEIVKKYASSKLQNGDIIIADAAEDETVGKCTEIANLQGVTVLAGLHTIPVRARINFSCGYLGYYMNSSSYHDQLLPLMQGTKVSSISKSAIQDTMILHPKSADEQQKIGDYFRNLDNLITLHQRECFSFDFSGESAKTAQKTISWEQRELNSIADVRDGTHASPQYFSSGHPFITSKNVKDGYINYDDVQFISDEDFEEINKRSKVDVNDILMGMIGTIGNLALVRETPDFAIKNVALIKDTGDIYYRYLYHCLQSEIVLNQLTENMDGGTQKFVALNRIRELYIPFPSRPEQEAIGTYFRNLDNLITLHQHKPNKKGHDVLSVMPFKGNQRKPHYLCT